MRHVFKIAGVILVALICNAFPDEWGPVEQTEFFSPAHKYTLKIQPDPDWPNKPGHCSATLFRLGPKKEMVWSRDLINDQAPGRVYVADSGEYVLTMDEWGNVGKLPVVIYGRRGVLIRVHSIESLGLDDDILKIKQTVSSQWWNEDSISFFSADEELFLTRLHWGKWIVIELNSGDLVTKGNKFYRDGMWKEPEQIWKSLDAYRMKQLSESVVRLLSSNKPEERKTGALVAGQEKLKETIPRLRQLLTDKEFFTVSGGGYAEPMAVLYVRKAAVEALISLGQAVKNVKYEFPEKQVVKYDKSMGRYVVDLPE